MFVINHIITKHKVSALIKFISSTSYYLLLGAM